jgi:hypothetical protein
VAADVVEDANVGVCERGDCLRLALEAPPAVSVGLVVGRKSLDRDEPVQESVSCLVHVTIPPEPMEAVTS